jgi:hypothetical protein
MGETTGGTRVDYLSDALGSVTATTNGSGAVQNRYRYKPYGSRLSKVGTAPDPKFQWVGRWGYKHSNASVTYVRARHLLAAMGVWTTVDATGRSPKYLYADGTPTTLIDAQGEAPAVPNTRPEFESSFGCNQETNEFIWKYCNWCYSPRRDLAEDRTGCQALCHAMASAYYDECKKPRRDSNKTFRPPLDPFGNLIPGEVAPRSSKLTQAEVRNVVFTEIPCEQRPSLSNVPCHLNIDVTQCANYGFGILHPLRPRDKIPRTKYVFNVHKCRDCCSDLYLPRGFAPQAAIDSCYDALRRCNEHCDNVVNAWRALGWGRVLQRKEH